MQPTSITPANATPLPTVPNPTKPVIITVIGLIIGAATMAQAYFGSGHIPSAAELGGLLSGAGITVGSVVGFLVHHLGINKAMLLRDVAIVTSSKQVMPTPVTASPPMTAS